MAMWTLTGAVSPIEAATWVEVDRGTDFIRTLWNHDRGLSADASCVISDASEPNTRYKKGDGLVNEGTVGAIDVHEALSANGGTPHASCFADHSKRSETKRAKGSIS